MYTIKDLVIDKSIKNVFEFVPKAKLLGIFLVITGLYSLYFNSIWYHVEKESIVLVYIVLSILYLVMGIINIVRSNVPVFLSSVILLTIVILLNISEAVITGNVIMPFVSGFSIIIIVISWRTFFVIKRLDICDRDVQNYRFILQEYNKFKTRDNSIKINVSNMFTSTLNCIVIDNIVLATGRYKINRHIAYKEELKLFDIKENRITKVSRGKLRINGKILKFKLTNKKLQMLNGLL